MSRMSARYLAPKMGLTASSVYSIWNDMGLVEKDQYGDWVLTDLGKNHGGRPSKNDRLSVPTFDSEIIIGLMMEFLDKKRETKNGEP